MKPGPMKPGSKYYPLCEHLKQCNPDEVHFRFEEIEAIMGQPLPASARKQRAWWSNRDSDRALQAKAWIAAGYHVKVIDLDEAIVTFGPFQTQYTVQREAGAIVWNQVAIKALRKSMGLTQAKFAQELGIRRQTVSEWETGVYQPDRSTAKHLELIADTTRFRAE